MRRTIDLPCEGVSKITLAADVPGGDRNRAIWGNARVLTENGEAVYLSDVLKQQGELPNNPPQRWLGRVDPEPETKTISESKGNKIIERDWLMQAEGESLGQRALNEIGWARQMAARILKTADAQTKEFIDAELGKLSSIEKRLLEDPKLKASHRGAQEIKDSASLTQILGTSIVHTDADISIPVDNGIYKIQLLIYEGWGGSHGRAADISIEGKCIANNCNYWTQQGKNTSAWQPDKQFSRNH